MAKETNTNPEEKKRFSETKKYKSNNDYIKSHYSQVKLSMPNSEAEELNAFLKEHGIKSKAGFIREAIKKEMNRIKSEDNK